MNWIVLKRSKILVKGKKSKLNLKGIQEEHKAFLHNLLTNDINNLADKKFNYNFMLDSKGSPLLDFFVYNDENKFIIDTDQNPNELIEKFNKLKLSLQVFFEILDYKHLYIFGDDSKKILSNLGLPTPEKFSFEKTDKFYIANNPLRLGVSGFDLFGNIDEIVEKLDKNLQINENDFEDLRIKNCIPKIGKELKENILPLETNIWKYAISLNKGCYVGQEAIARVYYRGKPPRVMAKFSFSKNVKEGEKITFDEKPVGTITSITKDGHEGIGFILRSKVWEGKDYNGIILLKTCEELNV
ncbi:folate-binding protein [Sulfurihydrogenibium sp.]|uniref:CAF17-like 4Fe-4S cluster assembly/insertion protein YgfZ n=1 Tax=Sulfurihydrogenibium sp. TaxID=2053621 RepID=UPI002615BD83|nr:folate-binding protein [Sulfurihydrogenibium sp.]